ncbi:Peroxiredoxin [Rivularia sp. PCC 7116]|uniref:peroxiredoxin-like family protein n=1 Tax=Rivularia sp. PCC 7116 TaxID=373994 RepID=UPI00029F2FC7|nr:peroxiredoxin-like family protein [Rivularia sp. PCC 7116]AFY54766.1 Peroxiredoxin [Rivularia sp. PCC 7116]
MNLQTALNNFQAEFKEKVPAEAAATMERAANELLQEFEARNLIKIGDIAPDFTLADAVGNKISLKERLTKGAVILTFYRGGWCPYCNLELRAYQQLLPEIERLGASLIAVSPQTPDASLSTAEKNDLEFDVLSDVDLTAARTYGLVFELSQELKALYQQWGIDLPKNNGNNEWKLPVPGTFVIDQNGRIAASYINTDYTKRLEPKEAIAALQKLSHAAAV